MAPDEQDQARILAAASALFRANGFGGTTVEMVAREADVKPHTVRRLVGGRRDLLSAVLQSRTEPPVAELVGRAAAANSNTPPLPALIEAAHELILQPQDSWDPLELEVLARARDDEGMRTLAQDRILGRLANASSVAASSRKSGGVDQELSDAAIVHLAMALSLGMAMLDPVAPQRPTPAQWDALIARIGAAVAPDELLLEPEFEVSQRWRVRVDVPDRPGGIARLVRALAGLHIYTVYLQVVGIAGGSRTIDIGLIAPEHVSAAVIAAAAQSAGSNAHVTRSGPGETGEDLLTLTIDGATQVVKHPEDAPRVAAALVAADSFEVIEATHGADDRADVLRLQWTSNKHVLLHRSWAPFARLEQTRASAVLRLSAAIARISGDREQGGWVDQVKTGTIWIRLARPEDSDAVARMHDRSSERSRYQRYFSVAHWRDLQLRRLAGGHRGASLVAMSRDGDIIALGNVFPDETEAGDPAAEIALLVEDAHQGTGVGTAMLTRMLQVARDMGFKQVVADVLAENRGMIRLLGRTGLDWHTSYSEGVAHMVAPLPELPLN